MIKRKNWPFYMCKWPAFIYHFFNAEDHKALYTQFRHTFTPWWQQATSLTEASIRPSDHHQQARQVKCLDQDWDGQSKALNQQPSGWTTSYLMSQSPPFGGRHNKVKANRSDPFLHLQVPELSAYKSLSFSIHMDINVMFGMIRRNQMQKTDEWVF